MKTAGINELRALVANALTKEDHEKMVEALIRATELAQEEDHTGTATKADLAMLRADLSKEISDLRSEVQKDFRDQTWRLTTTFTVVILAATVLNHFWR